MLIGDVEVLDREGRPVRDPGEIESEAEFVRARLAPKPPAQQQIKTPDDIIDELDWAKHFASKMALLVKDADRSLRALQRLYALKAAGVKSSAKSIDERTREVELALPDLVAAIDEAEVVLEFTKRVGKSVEASTSALQTQAGLVKVTYALAGTGRES